MSQSTITVTPLTPRIGAEIAGIDLGRPLAPAAVQAIHEALIRHLVVFFRDQDIDHAAHEALGKHFGELQVHPTSVPIAPEYPGTIRIHIDKDSTAFPGELWHSDLSASQAPPLGSILKLHEVPAVGGDTLFASMYAAYEALSPRLQRYLEGLTAHHDARIGLGRLNERNIASFPEADHPVVILHPVTRRKVLYVSPGYVTHINELPRAESDAILRFLFEHIAKPDFQVRFKWRPHSIAFWDNRSAQHLALWDYYPQTRSGYRVTIKGSVPIPA